MLSRLGLGALNRSVATMTFCPPFRGRSPALPGSPTHSEQRVQSARFVAATVSDNFPRLKNLGGT
jgi:hypothetical protein